MSKHKPASASIDKKSNYHLSMSYKMLAYTLVPVALYVGYRVMSVLGSERLEHPEDTYSTFDILTIQRASSMASVQEFNKIKVLNSLALSSSESSGILYSYNGTKGFVGRQWLLKKNRIDWTFREYISHGIYKHFLNNLVPEMALVSDKNAKAKETYEKIRSTSSDLYEEEKPPRIVLAIEFLTSLQVIAYPLRKAYGVNFECLKGGCRIINGVTHTISSSSITKIDDKKLHNFYPSCMVSNLLADLDIDYGNNYAIIQSEHQYDVSRIDYDASLGFFEADGVSRQLIFFFNGRKGEYGATIPTQYGGYRNVTLHNMMLAFYGYDVKLPKWHLRHIPLLKAINDIATSNITELNHIISQKVRSFQLAAEEMGLDLSTSFSVHKMQNLLGTHDSNVFSLLEKYTKKRIAERVEDFKLLHTCVRLEIAAKFDNATMFNQVVEENHRSLPNISCSPIYMDSTNGFAKVLPVTDIIKHYPAGKALIDGIAVVGKDAAANAYVHEL